MKVDNAIILSAGTSSRFAPLSFEKHKALTVVRGDVLIERQIRQLQSAGISDIYIVTGYKSEQFEYLIAKFDVKLIYNANYLTRNNNGSIWVARNHLKNSYVCSADNYFTLNPFETDVEDSYYSALYADGHTCEWCMTENEDGYINSVTIGGKDSWFMMGHTFWSNDFSHNFLKILNAEYNKPETINKLWETIFIDHLPNLKMKIRKYNNDVIHEFDTLDDLRQFDSSYVTDTRSTILKKLARKLTVAENQINNIIAVKSETEEAVGFSFDCKGEKYTYLYETDYLERNK